MMCCEKQHIFQNTYSKSTVFFYLSGKCSVLMFVFPFLPPMSLKIFTFSAYFFFPIYNLKMLNLFDNIFFKVLYSGLEIL